MDGVKARLPKSPPRRPQQTVTPGLEDELTGVEAIVTKASPVEVTNKIRIASFSIQGEECRGKLRYITWGSFVLLAFTFMGSSINSVSKLRKDLGIHGWEVSKVQEPSDLLFRVLSDPSETVVASQILLLLDSLGLTSSALTSKGCAS